MRGALGVVVVLAVLLVSGCTSEDGKIILSYGMVLTESQCSERGIEDSVVVFHSPGCPACARAVPVLEEISGEMPEKDFRFLNLAADREDINELGLVPSHVPTVVIECKVHVGARTKEEYLSYIG